MEKAHNRWGPSMLQVVFYLSMTPGAVEADMGPLGEPI